MFFAFQAIEPTGGDLVGLIPAFLSEAKTAFFDLAQRELPLPPNRTEPCANPCHPANLPVLLYAANMFALLPVTFAIHWSIVARETYDDRHHSRTKLMRPFPPRTEQDTPQNTPSPNKARTVQVKMLVLMPQFF